MCPKSWTCPKGRNMPRRPSAPPVSQAIRRGEDLAVEQLASISCLLILQPRSVLLFHMMSLTLGMNSL